MIAYEPLTKKITDENGNQMVVCRFHGTDKCRDIHTPNQCISCPMLAKMIIQLNAFEEVYMEETNNDE